jgi:hypothetical protein
MYIIVESNKERIRGEKNEKTENKIESKNEILRRPKF